MRMRWGSAMSAQPEYHIQVALAQWLRIQYPRILWTASAGGMRTGIATAKKMKAMGYRKGCPDLLIFEPRGSYHGLFVELKAPGGTKSTEQKAFIKQAEDLGYCACFAFGFEEARKMIEDYINDRLHEKDIHSLSGQEISALR